MRQARRELSTWLLRSDRGAEIENWEVGVFFELLGSLTRARILNKKMVWSAFGPWVSGYYVLMTRPIDLITQWRKEGGDPNVFAEFEWLAKQVLEMDWAAAYTPRDIGALVADARDVLENESHLDPRPEPGPMS
jgi:hypothetical protein